MSPVRNVTHVSGLDSSRMAHPTGVQETGGINGKRRLTGTLSPKGNRAVTWPMANPDQPPKRRKIKAPAPAGTEARAAKTQAAKLQAAHYAVLLDPAMTTALIASIAA